MQAIRDIILVPEVETVVQVSAVAGLDEDGLRSRFIETFVLTEDSMRAIESVLVSIGKDTGSGFLVKGGYGSGKSHLIAFLASLFLHPELIGAVFSAGSALASRGADMARRPILPVFLTLTDYPSTSALSNIMIDALSNALRDRGMTGPLANAKAILTDFERVMLPSVKENFEEYLAEKGKENFSDTPEHERADTVLGFLRDSNIAFRPHYDYRDVFERVDGLIGERYPGGVFFLIDELSEFLRARGKNDLVAEDIRFIQFIGERASKKNLRVLFSMQESIEEVADVSADGLNRIKDRYPVRINLTAFHLRELVEKRLLLKKPGAFEQIDALWSSLADSFPGWKTTKEEFRAIYPVHPATFEMLEGIAGLFSKTRGMVDFIVSETAGDDSRGIRGILDEPPECLLYPDRIFDHFRNNLQESVVHNRLMSVVFDSVERSVSSHFDRKNDAETALRVAKLIILRHIAPAGSHPSARELAHLVFENRFSIDPEYNYTFIREKILKNLEIAWPYLGVEKGAAALDDRFFVLQKETPLARFEQSAVRFLKNSPRPEKQSLWYFISSVGDDDIPLAEFTAGERHARVSFEQTPRQGLVILKNPSAFTESDRESLARKLMRDEFDFSVIMGFPIREDDESERFREIAASITARFSECVFFWKPRVPGKQEIDAILGHYARVKVAEKQEQGPVDPAVRERVETSRRDAVRIIKELYAEGDVAGLVGGAVKRLEFLFTNSFDKTVQLFARDALKTAFPAHVKIMPSVEIGSAETFNQIIMLFREKSEIDFNFEGSRMLKNSIDALLKSGGLFAVNRSQYRVSPDPSKNPFVKDLLYEIEKNPCSFDELYFNFRKGPYGIRGDMFRLYLFFLARAGNITLKRSGKILKHSTLDMKTIQLSDMICSGEDLSTLFIGRYSLLGPFAEGLNPKNIHLQAQEKVWEKLIDFKRSWEGAIDALKRRHREMETYPIFENNPPAGVGAALERVGAFAGKIKTSKSARDGLNELLSGLPDDTDITGDIDIAKRFDFFLREEFERIVFIYNYLISPDLAVGDNEDLKQEMMSLIARFRTLDNVIMTGSSGVIFERFDEFRDEYKKHYELNHRRVHDPDSVAAYERVRLSPLYRVMANLMSIEVIPVPEEATAVERTLRSVSQSLCRRSVSRELATRPFCECRLRRDAPQLDPEELHAAVARGIVRYMVSIADEKNSIKITNYMGALLSAGEADKRDVIKAAMEMDPSNTAEIDMLRIITPEAATLISRALSSNIRVVDKNIDEFAASVAGGRFSIGELRKKFDQWLNEGGRGEGETIIRLTGRDSVDDRPVLSPLALDALKRSLPGVDEGTIMRALALYLLLLPLAEDRRLSVIRKVLHVDASDGAMEQCVERYREFFPGSTMWERLFSQETIAEILDALDLSSMDIQDLIRLYNSSAGFPAIRETLLIRFMDDDFIFTGETVSRLEMDDGIYSEILSSMIECKNSGRRFFSEIGRAASFNASLFIRAFSALMSAENIRRLTMNNRLGSATIADRVSKISEDIERSCEDYFAVNFASWESDDDISPRAIIRKILTASSPVIVLFDSLRFDLYLRLKPLIEKAGLRAKGAEFYLGPRLSDTMNFREALFPGVDLTGGLAFDLYDRKWIFISAAERDYRREELRSILNSGGEENIILSISLLDEKIHSTKQSVGGIAEELALFCEQTLLPLLEAVPKGREIIFMNDHGFIEMPRYGSKNEPRYTHGGNSFYERLLFTAGWEIAGKK